MRPGLVVSDRHSLPLVSVQIYRSCRSCRCSDCGCKKFQLDPFGDHLYTCTTQSGAKKAHDWVVDQITDLFHTTHKVKTQQVVRSRGKCCGDIELVT
jgi:hypothetical protein